VQPFKAAWGRLTGRAKALRYMLLPSTLCHCMSLLLSLRGIKCRGNLGGVAAEGLVPPSAEIASSLKAPRDDGEVYRVLL